MTQKEVVLMGLEELGVPSNFREFYDYINKKEYFECDRDSLTPYFTVSGIFLAFIKTGDIRVRRFKNNPNENYFLYYLYKNEEDIENKVEEKGINDSSVSESKNNKGSNSGNLEYKERDIHMLLNTYLNSDKIHAKTIFMKHQIKMIPM